MLVARRPALRFSEVHYHPAGDGDGEFIEVFNRLAMPVLMQTLGHPLGFWTSLVGPQNQFVHLWGYDSLADYEARCRARDADPGMAEYFKATVGMIAEQETRLIRRVELASLKAL